MLLDSRTVRLFRMLSTRSGPQSIRNPESGAAGKDQLHPHELAFLSKQEITAQDVHNRLHLICPAYTSHAEWKPLAIKYPAVFYRKNPVVKQILNLLTQDNFISDRMTILQHLWVLQFTPSALKDKIMAIRVLAASDFTTIPIDDQPPGLPDYFKICLTPFSERVIFWLMRRYKLSNKGKDSLERLHGFNERIDFLADKLAVFPFDIIEQLDKKYMHRLILRPHEQMVDMMQLYADIGFQSLDLRKHMWLLTRTRAGLKPRIDMLQQYKVKIRPWMLSAPFSELDRVKLQATIVNEFQTVPNILMKKLNIDYDKVKSMIAANPQLENRTLTFSHLADIIDFLLSEGYSEKEIAECPKSLTIPLPKLKTRILELKSLDSAYLLLHAHESQYNFDRLIDQVVKSKNEEETLQ